MMPVNGLNTMYWPPQQRQTYPPRLPGYYQAPYQGGFRHDARAYRPYPYLMPPAVPGPSAKANPTAELHSAVNVRPAVKQQLQPWNNRLKHMFRKNQAVIYALHLRTFGANDANGDGQISPEAGESGTFLSTIPKLAELEELGVNTLHLLPIHPVSRTMRLGQAGSPYAPADLHELNPEYGNLDEAKKLVQESHQRGMHVMVDVPTFPSYELAEKYPELIARDAYGNPLKPNNWLDVLMFENNGALVDYYEGFFELMQELDVDGFRVDVARVRPAWFWDYFISKYPDKAWLAESYSHQDASPMQNIPRDVPEHLLKIGFDAVYGQFHRFPEMRSATEYVNYLVERHGMLRRAGLGKSFIGSFLTPYDYSLMDRGGVTMSFLVSGLMATQPWSNPYILDGFTTGYAKPFDMFNYRPRPQGGHPEIGDFLKKMLNLRRGYEDIITQGLFIPIPQGEGMADSQVVAYARHHKGRTLLVVANKDVNSRSKATLTIPGLRADQKLVDRVPEYGRQSSFVVDNNRMDVELGPGRIHIFEVQTPGLPLNLQSYR